MATVRMLKATSWDGADLAVGAEAEVADGVARRWRQNGIAEVVGELPPEQPAEEPQPATRGRRTAPAAHAEPADEEE